MTRADRWNVGEDKYLRENHAHTTHAQIGEFLSRSVNAVRNRCFLIGIKKRPRKHGVEIDECIRLAYEAAAGGSIELANLSKEIGLTRNLIARKAKALGLTNVRRPSTDAARLNISIAKKKWMSENDHPRGALGMVHSPETLEKISMAAKRMWKNKTPEQIQEAALRMSRLSRAYSKTNRASASWKAGWREFGGRRTYFRSRWEANYGRWLEFLKVRGEILDWEHEPETFWFEGIKRGCMSYLPDFRVTEHSGAVAYHEVKGWMDQRSATAIQRMAKYHPKVRLIVIDSKGYRTLARETKRLVPGWERGEIRILDLP